MNPDRHRAIVVAFISTLTLGSVAPGAGEPRAANLSPSERRFESFDADSLRAERARRGESYYRFLDRSALSAGLYHLGVGETDDQQPHRLDEVYYVLDGAAQLSIAGESRAVARGDVHFVRAGVEHRFHDITAPLDVIVVFSKTPSVSSTAAGRSFTMAEIAAARDPAQNEWNAFLQIPSMVFGLYMLPKQLGGDSDLTHETEEINILVSGSGVLNVAGDEVPVEAGQIVFVERGAPHRFLKLAGDLDVLILWNR